MGCAHRAEHWPEGEQLVAVVAAAATPGAPARIISLLQNELLSLEVRVLEAHPSGKGEGELGGICPASLFPPLPFCLLCMKRNPNSFSNPLQGIQPLLRFKTSKLAAI